MRVLAIAHEADAGPGVFADAIAAAGATLDEWLLPAAPSAPPDDPASYDAVMVFGGSMHADQEALHPWLAAEKTMLRDLLGRKMPLLGVCLGSQLLAEAAGAPAERAPDPEIGWFPVEVTAAGRDDPLMGELAPGFDAFQWHSYRSPLPPRAVELARSPAGLQAYRAGDRAWGIQFHAEVSEPDALSWAAGYGNDPDAVRVGVDPERMAAGIRMRMPAWNRTGRALCARFLDAAAAR
jgi:GMP synthase (glutamine-hydrolysing)